MESFNAIILARSRFEAMDRSLVLLSQGIESIVEHSTEQGWLLRVSDSDYQKAQEAIRLYVEENRKSRWRREVLRAGLFFDWTCIAWAALLAALYWINDSRTDLKTPGLLDSVAVSHGQWWRLFTAVWLHADLAHLASNIVFGILLLGLTMGRYGTGVGLLAAYVAGVGGNVFAAYFSSGPHYGLGASGMVMGCLGLLSVRSMTIWRSQSGSRKYLMTGLFGGTLLFVLLGVAPETDVVAHLGGFVCGFALGVLMPRSTRQLQKPFFNTLAILCFLALFMWSWWLAIRHSAH